MADEIIESESTTPLLRPIRQGSDVGTTHYSTLALLLGRSLERSNLSMQVRETAAQELEGRRADWGYSIPAVALDIFWNLVFVVSSIVILVCSTEERPNVPIRVWICVYALQCLVHAVLVSMEYRRRIRRIFRDEDSEQTTASQLDFNDIQENEASGDGSSSQPSVTKRFGVVNTLVSCIWWLVGFYWVVTGGDELVQGSPQLYWLSFVFLALDFFFSAFCVILACLIGTALCCCLPCIIGIMYAFSGQKGASDEDIGILPKYKYESRGGRMVPIDTGVGYLANDRILLGEDAECCICITSYEDGTELHSLPCGHHFHVPCIVKWLKMNSTCPLCKLDILKRDDEDVDDRV